MAKRYFWLKLKEDYFNSPRIKKLRKIAGGDTFVIIYLKMQLMSVSNGAVIEYEGIEPTFAEELALKLDEDVDNVSVVLAFLQGSGLIETSDNSLLFLETNSNIGSESEGAERKRRFDERKKEKALQSNGEVTSEKRSSISSSISTSKKVNNSMHEEKFNAFWKAYPRKGDKAKARKIFEKLMKEKDLDIDMVISKAGEYLRSVQGQDQKFVRLPTTWLNGRNWEDEIFKPKGEEIISRNYTSEEISNAFSSLETLDEF